MNSLTGVLTQNDTRKRYLLTDKEGKMKKILPFLLLLFSFNIANAQVNIHDLTEDTSPAGTDLAYTIKNPSTIPVGRKAQWSNVMKLSGWIDGGTTVYLNTTSDKVAIGKTNASTALDVLGTVSATAFVGDGSGLTGISGGVGIGTSSPNGWVDGGPNVYNTMTTDNVGIGTTTPASNAKLDVRGGYLAVGSGANTNAISQGELYVAGDAEIDGTVYSTSPQFATSTITPKIIGGSGTTQTLTYQTTSGIGATGADHIFLIGNNGATEAMRIFNSGNIGVGSANPGSKLDVNTSSLKGLRLIYNGSASPTNDARIIAGNNDGTPIGIGNKLGSFVFGANDGTGFLEGSAIVSKAEGTWTNTSHPTSVYIDTTATGSTTRTERFKIDSLGRMGLGTSAPNSTATIIKRGAENVLSVSSASSQLSDFLVVGSAGNVGIGTPLPQTLMQFKGGDVKIGAGSFTNTSSNEDLSVAGNIQFNGQIYGDGSQLTGISGGGANGGWTDGGVNVYQTTTTDSVGIGTTTASATVEIVKQTATIPLMVSATATGDGNYLIVTSGGNVGIGSVAPRSALDVNGGTISATSTVGIGTTRGVLKLSEASANGSNYIALVPGNSLAADTTFILPTADGTSGQAIITDGAGTLSFGSVASSAGWTDGGTNVYTSTTTDNVGIGTTTPNAATLEIVKNAAQPPLKISATASGNGNYLVVTSAGNVGIGTTTAGNLLVVNGAMQSLSTGDSIFSSGNVGIGTSSPVAPLSVTGVDNGTVASLLINTAQSNITTADSFIKFNASDGTIGTIAGTGSSGIIAYNTFTGAHWTQVEDVNDLFEYALLCSNGKIVDWGQNQLTKSHVCSKKADQTIIGSYGGNSNNRDQIMAIGTGYMVVINKGEDINIGDYLYSSDVMGYAEKQKYLFVTDNTYRNYTAAKAMQPIKWANGEKSRKIAVIYLGG